jgi:hypothetical protein
MASQTALAVIAGAADAAGAAVDSSLAPPSVRSVDTDQRRQDPAPITFSSKRPPGQ